MANIDIDFLVKQHRAAGSGISYEQRLAAYRKMYEYSQNFESGAGKTFEQIKNSDTNKKVTDYFKKNGVAGAGHIDTSGITAKSDFRELLGRQTQKTLPSLEDTVKDIKTKKANAVYNEPRAKEYERTAREFQRKADNARNRRVSSKQTYANDIEGGYRKNLNNQEKQYRERAAYYKGLAEKLKNGEDADAQGSYFESWNKQLEQYDKAAEQAKQTETMQFAQKSAGERGVELDTAKFNLQKWTEEKNHGHSSYPDSYIDAQIEKFTDKVQRLTAADEAGRYNDAQKAKDEDAKKYLALSTDELKRELEIAKNSRAWQEKLQSDEWYAGGTGMSFTDTIEYYDDRIDMLERALYNVDRRDKLGEYEKVREKKDFGIIAAQAEAGITDGGEKSEIEKYEALGKDELKRQIEVNENSRRAQEELQSREWDMGGTGMSYTDTIEYYDDRIKMLKQALYNVENKDMLRQYEQPDVNEAVEACIDVIQSGNSDGEDARKWKGVNNVGNKAIFAKKLETEYEKLYGTDEYADIFGDVFNKLPELNVLEPYSWMTEKEYDTYNYLYAKEGEKAAEEYFSLLQDDIDERRRQSEKKTAAKYASEQPIDATVVSIGTNLFGFAGIMDTVGESVRNMSRDVKKPLTATGQAYSNTAITETMRGTVQEDMSDTGRFFYGVATSAADNLMQTAVFGKDAAPIVMSGSAATSAFYDLAEQGVSSDKATAVAVMAGVFEFAFERLGLQKVFDPLDNAMANYSGLWHYLKDSVFSEFAEEAGTEAANIVTSALLLGKDSEWANKLRELNTMGISDGEALRQVLKDYGLQIVEAGLAGAVTGSVLGGYNALTTGIKAQNTGADMTAGDTINVTLQTLAQSSEATVADLATQLTENMNNKQLTMRDLTRIIDAATASTDAATAEAGAKLDAKLKNALMKGKGANISPADLLTLAASVDENVRNTALDVTGLDLNVIEQLKQNALETGDPRARRAAQLLEKLATGKGSTAYERGLSFMQLEESIDENETRQKNEQQANAERPQDNAENAQNNNAAEMPSVEKILSDAAYDAVDAAYGRGEGVDTQDLTEAYDELYGRITKENAENSNVTNDKVTNEDNVNIEIKDDMPDDERQKAIENKTIKIVPYTEGVLTNEEMEDVQKSYKRDLKREFKKIGERLNIFKHYENKNIGGQFIFSKNSLEESGHKQTVRGGSSTSFVKMLSQLDGIIDNAVLIETHTDQYAGTIREDLSLKRVYVLLSAYEDGGIVPVQLEVKEYTNKDNKLYMAVTLNKISTEVKTLRRGQNSPLINANSVDTISVRELVEKINPSDGKFLRYIPDGMLNDEQIAAKRAADESKKSKIDGFEKKGRSGEQTKTTGDATASKGNGETKNVDNSAENRNAETKNNGKNAENRSDEKIAPSPRPLTEAIAEKYGQETAEDYSKKLKKSEKKLGDRYGIDGDFSEKLDALYGMMNDKDVSFEDIEREGMKLAREMIETAEGYSAVDPDGTMGVREEAAGRLYNDLYNDYLRTMGDAIRAGELATGTVSAEGIIAAYDLYPGEITDAVKMARGESTGHTTPPNYNVQGIRTLAEFFKTHQASAEVFDGEYNIDEIKMTARETAGTMLDPQTIEQWMKNEGASATIERLTHKIDEKDAQIFKMRQRQREQAEKRKRTETNRRLREDIKKSLKDVVKRLETPTPQKHVPTGMEGVARELIDTFELDGQERPTNEGRLFADRVNALGTAAANMENKGMGDPAFAEAVRSKVAELQSRAGDIVYLSDANGETLRCAKELADMVKKGFAEADETHAMETKQRVSELAEGAITTLEGKKKHNAVFRAAQQSGYNFGLMDHAAFFDLLGEKTGTAMRECFDGGLEKYATNVREVAEYMGKIIKDNKIDVRKLETEMRDVKLSGGNVQMSVSQLMDLYELSMRPEAQEHLLNGSVWIEKQNKLTGQWEKDTRITLKEQDYAAIREALTDTERNVANAMQKYMAFQDAMKGNETSRMLYGFDRYQVGGGYWTMRVDKTTTNTTERNKATGTAELYQKPGFTHQVDAYAKNPLLIRGAFDTFVQHSLQMAAYNAFAPVTSDAMKVLNYRDAQSGASFKSAMESALGKEAQKFYEGLIQDVNGMSRSGDSVPLMGRLYRNAKAAAIMANVSVIVQQPTAYLRAAAVIDPKYLIKGMKSPDAGKASERTARMYEYAPMTYWKSVGGADINTGKSMTELILDNGSGYSKVQNFLMAGAGKADDITWSKLWNACLWEATDRGFTPRTEAWYKAARTRMNEIVDYTQVIDSPLHRSQMMKSKGMTQLFTQFMSEPVKSVNVMRRAITEAGQLTGTARAKPILRSATALLVTGVVNSAVKSVIYAMRDNDDRDDEGNKRTYWDKWLEKFKENELDELNFINNFPILKELWEAGDTAVKAIKGENAFSSGNEALYEKGIGEIIDFISALADDEKSGYDKTKAGVRALSTLSGMGVYNIWRDVEALIKTVTPEDVKLQSKFRDNFYGQEDTLKEILNMYMQGNNKVLKKDTPPKTVKTQDGEEITLNKEQKEQYREAYNVAYSQIADAVRLTDIWEKLTDKQKSTALEKIKTQAAQEGRYAITGYPADEDGEVKRTSIEEYAESCVFTALTKGEKKKAGKIAAIERALGVNTEEANYYYQLYGEHAEEDEARSKAREQLVKSWDENDTRRSARAAGLTEKEYESYKKGLSELESTKDADGKSLTGSLTSKKLAYIARQVKDDKAAVYLAKEATSGQTRDIIDAAETAGALDRDFLKKLSDYSRLTGEKDEDGDTISNSKKAAQLEWISANCTEKQSAAFLKGTLTSEKQSTVAEIVEKCGMNAKKFSGYLSECVTLTSSKKINNYLYSISGSADLNTRDLLYLATANSKNEYNVVLNRVINKLKLTEGERREYIRRLER